MSWTNPNRPQLKLRSHRRYNVSSPSPTECLYSVYLPSISHFVIAFVTFFMEVAKTEMKFLSRQHIKDIAKHPEHEDMLEEYQEQVTDLMKQIEGFRNQIQLTTDKHNAIYSRVLLLSFWQTETAAVTMTTAVIYFVCSRYCVGVLPSRFLNCRLKYEGLLYPTIELTSFIDNSGFFSRSFAFSTRPAMISLEILTPNVSL